MKPFENQIRNLNESLSESTFYTINFSKKKLSEILIWTLCKSNSMINLLTYKDDRV